MSLTLHKNRRAGFESFYWYPLPGMNLPDYGIDRFLTHGIGKPSIPLSSDVRVFSHSSNYSHCSFPCVYPRRWVHCKCDIVEEKKCNNRDDGIMLQVLTAWVVFEIFGYTLLSLVSNVCCS